jgi:L-fuconolactonase
VPGSIVDAHFHVWDPVKRRHDWLQGAPPELRRRFDIDEFATIARARGVVASVVVEAVDTRQETQDLVEVAGANTLVAGVVGWVDLAAADVADAIAACRHGPGGEVLVGARHLVQSEPDPRWLERSEVIRGLKALAAAGLTYDLLVRPRELASALVAVDAVEGGRFVLDHGAKPEIAAGITEPWSSMVGEFARRPHVTCKLSGLVTEARHPWRAADMAPYIDRLVEVFGPERLMFGSDWPVCTAAASYAEVVDLATSLLAERLGPAEPTMVMTANAVETYRLRLPASP